MKALSLFSGAGGFELGFDSVGIETVAFAESDPNAQAVLRHRWPNTPIFDDVKEVSNESFKEEVDVVVGGFPCQDISSSGLRAGLAGRNSSSWYEFNRVLSELRPQWFVVENVSQLLLSNDGRDMGTILRAVGKLGYGFAYRMLDAQYFGVPQQRRRIFIVGHLDSDGRSAGQILFETESSTGNTKKVSQETKWHFAFGDSGSTNKASRVVTGTVGTTFGPKNYSNTQEVRYGSIQPLPDGRIRRFMPVEAERILGWPDGHTEPAGNDQNRFRLCGNGVAKPVSEWLGARLTSSQGASQFDLMP